MELDPRLTGEWPDTVVLCWEAPYSLRNHKALYAALISDEGVPSDYLGPGGLSDLVSSIEGYLLQVEYGDFGSLQWMLKRARQYDVPVRRVYMLSTFGDVEARVAPLDKHPAVIAWLVPTQSLSGTGRRAPEGSGGLAFPHGRRAQSGFARAAGDLRLGAHRSTGVPTRGAGPAAVSRRWLLGRSR